jgi:hypothetical protein
VFKTQAVEHGVLIGIVLSLIWVIGCKCSDSELPAGTCQMDLPEDAFELNEEFEGEEGPDRAEPEIHLEEDPFQLAPMGGPSFVWEDAIRAVKVRKLEVPPAEVQRSRIRELLGILENESDKPNAQQVAESEAWLRNLHSIIPDHEKFVAASFDLFYPAWHELLKDSGRKSARTVLSWLRNGCKPKFVGTAGAKPEKLRVALQMLRKVMPEKEIRRFLAGKFPQRLEFRNYASLFKKWSFSSEQIFKLVQAGAAGI